MRTSRFKICRPILAIVTLCLLTTIGCTDESIPAFARAKELNSKEAYLGFISTYPESTYSDSAVYFLHFLEMTLAERDSSGELLRVFMTQHPGSALIDTCQKKLEYFDYRLALNTPSVDSYESFLNAYPDSQYSMEVDSLIVAHKYRYSDKAIKARVLKEYKKCCGANNCYKKQTVHIKVKNGHASIGINCVRYGQCQGSNMSSMISAGRGCGKWLTKTVKPRIQRVDGVKSVSVSDYGDL